MRQLNLLVLTDHSGHSQENSIYGFIPALLKDPRCGQIDVASRGFAANTHFFEGKEGSTLQIRTASQDFHFDEKGLSLFPERSIDDLSGYDAIFLRLPPPASRPFFQYLEKQAPHSVIFNKPGGILETSSKAFLMHFRQICPPMRLCYNLRDISLFAERFPIVLKPLYNYGGKGIVRVEDHMVFSADKRYTLEEYVSQISTTEFPMLAMKFVDRIDAGDKRVLVVNGKVIGASLRLPTEGSWLCNVAQGGHAVIAEPDSRELEMARIISPVLLSKGILIFGFDTLMEGDGRRYLSEINTMSIGGFAPLEQQTGRPVLKEVATLIWDFIEERSGYGVRYFKEQH